MESGCWRPTRRPAPRQSCAVLSRIEEQRAANDEVRTLGLVGNPDPVKDWDSLSALDLILRHTTPDCRILDAGGELYSRILIWLFRYGYTHLECLNLAFSAVVRRGPIRYYPGDLTKTAHPDCSFQVVTCLSVIEHGVDLDSYFKEMWRLLRPGGLLITSTDYWAQGVDTEGKRFYGVPVKVFTQPEIEAALESAVGHGFQAVEPFKLECEDKVVYWEAVDLRYTFVLFALRKPEARPSFSD